MTPYFSDEWLTILEGDCRAVLPSLPADSVDCVVSSPPYWGLRDYGHTGQLGLERTPEEYVANMVAVFAEVRRVLKPSGTCWLNLGDSYNGYMANQRATSISANHQHARPEFESGRGRRTDALKAKDLVGIPWRVAFALQADGWYLRSDIIWSKPNPMPESVTDRPTKSHEYLFLLTKSARYYFDADAVREASWDQRPENTKQYAAQIAQHARRQPTLRGNGVTASVKGGREYDDSKFSHNPAGRNIRSVWTIATQPYPGAHFAVFPPELPERCIKAGSSERGVCPECGAPWERVVERTRGPIADTLTPKDEARASTNGWGQDRPLLSRKTGLAQPGWRNGPRAGSETLGWERSCDCERDGGGWDPTPAVILDPFAGSGTVGMVANRLSRRAILIDLNPEYLRQQMTRNAQTPLGLGAA